MDSVTKRVILTHKGVFYYAYEKDAVVIHNLMGYKLTTVAENQLRCGFSEKSLGKVIAKLSSLQISYRVFNPTKEDRLRISMEKEYEDDSNYIKYSVKSDFSEAYDFLEEICKKCEEYQESKVSSSNGLRMVIDLEDENTYKYFLMIKNKLDGVGIP